MNTIASLSRITLIALVTFIIGAIILTAIQSNPIADTFRFVQRVAKSFDP